jgi:O-antigen/teichoic acid export membrane protein
MIFSAIQLTALPLVSIFSPLKEVQDAARIPTVIGAALQLINGVVFVGEGIQQGNQSFGSLAISTIIATAGLLTSLSLFGKNLVGVWCSLGVFFLLRLTGILRHHFINGPFTKNRREKYKKLYERSEFEVS